MCCFDEEDKKFEINVTIEREERERERERERENESGIYMILFQGDRFVHL